MEETTYWLELIEELEIFDKAKLRLLRQEAEELTAILVTIVKKVKEKQKR